MVSQACPVLQKARGSAGFQHIASQSGVAALPHDLRGEPELPAVLQLVLTCKAQAKLGGPRGGGLQCYHQVLSAGQNLLHASGAAPRNAHLCFAHLDGAQDPRCHTFCQLIVFFGGFESTWLEFPRTRCCSATRYCLRCVFIYQYGYFRWTTKDFIL